MYVARVYADGFLFRSIFKNPFSFGLKSICLCINIMCMDRFRSLQLTHTHTHHPSMLQHFMWLAAKSSSYPANEKTPYARRIIYNIFFQWNHRIDVSENDANDDIEHF